MRTLLLILATALASETEAGSGTASSAPLAEVTVSVLVYVLVGTVAAVALVVLRSWMISEARPAPPVISTYWGYRGFGVA